MPADIHRHTVLRIVLLVGVLLLAGFSLWRFVPIPSPEDVVSFVRNAGAAGPLALITYIILSHVVAPLAGAPAFMASVALFGMFNTTVYFYIASAVSATINFYLGRRFGRALIARFAGRRALLMIDRLTAGFDAKMLFLLRVFGVPVFEEVSYAAGLTKILFRSYIFITLVGTLIPYGLVAFFFRNSSAVSLTETAFLTLALVGIAVLSAFLMKRSLGVKNVSED